MQAALESLERVWAEHNIVLPSFAWLPDNKDGTSNGTLTGQRSNMPGKFFEFPPSLYADDVAFTFASREDMIKGISRWLKNLSQWIFDTLALGALWPKALI